MHNKFGKGKNKNKNPQRNWSEVFVAEIARHSIQLAIYYHYKN
jgi:hypothetical protein